ncbi:type I toxin-antitoxin system Fst family toxin [Enterococcus sp. DIV0086]
MQQNLSKYVLSTILASLFMGVLLAFFKHWIEKRNKQSASE